MAAGLRNGVSGMAVAGLACTLGLALLAKLERMDQERAGLRVEVESRLARIESKLDLLLLPRPSPFRRVPSGRAGGQLREPPHGWAAADEGSGKGIVLSILAVPEEVGHRRTSGKERPS